VKQLLLLNFVKLKTTVKKAKVATPDDTETSSSHNAAVTKLRAELKSSEKLTIVKGKSCGDEDIYVALVETLRNPSPYSTPIIVYGSMVLMLGSHQITNGDDYRVQCMTQSHHSHSMDRNAVAQP